MLNNVQWSKYTAETVSIVLSFADLLSPGDTITGTPVITVTVYTGTDSNPSNLLYQLPTVTKGSVVEQRFRLGIPGVIYHILFTIQTVAGDTFDKESYLAILPEDGTAIPSWVPLWESTALYPYLEAPEYIQGRHLLVGGRLAWVAYPIPAEPIQGSIELVSGDLIYQSSVDYPIPHEDIQGASILVLGDLVYQTTVPYDIPHEDIKGGVALISGILTGHGIGYNTPHEDIQGTTILTSGTLA